MWPRSRREGYENDKEAVKAANAGNLAYTQIILEYRCLAKARHCWGSWLKRSVFNPQDVRLVAALCIQGLPVRANYGGTGDHYGDYMLDLTKPDQTGIYNGMADAYDMFVDMQPPEKVTM